jgi:hypothetical protein
MPENNIGIGIDLKVSGLDSIAGIQNKLAASLKEQINDLQGMRKHYQKEGKRLEEMFGRDNPTAKLYFEKAEEYLLKIAKSKGVSRLQAVREESKKQIAEIENDDFIKKMTEGYGDLAQAEFEAGIWLEIDKIRKNPKPIQEPSPAFGPPIKVMSESIEDLEKPAASLVPQFNNLSSSYRDQTKQIQSLLPAMKQAGAGLKGMEGMLTSFTSMSGPALENFLGGKGGGVKELFASLRETAADSFALAA